MQRCHAALGRVSGGPGSAPRALSESLRLPGCEAWAAGRQSRGHMASRGRSEASSPGNGRQPWGLPVGRVAGLLIRGVFVSTDLLLGHAINSQEQKGLRLNSGPGEGVAHCPGEGRRARGRAGRESRTGCTRGGRSGKGRPSQGCICQDTALMNMCLLWLQTRVTPWSCAGHDPHGPYTEQCRVPWGQIGTGI